MLNKLIFHLLLNFHKSEKKYYQSYHFKLIVHITLENAKEYEMIKVLLYLLVFFILRYNVLNLSVL